MIDDRDHVGYGSALSPQPGMIHDAQSLQIACVGHSLLAALP
jgi:hypothetical protein